MLLDEIKKREEREEREEREAREENINKPHTQKRNIFKETIPLAIMGLIIATPLAWSTVKGFEAERKSETYTKIEHVTYIKPYKYETIKKSWVNDEGYVIKRSLLKVYKQDGMKNDLPHWKYVKTVDYGEKKPNV